MTARPGENTDPQGRFALSGPYSALLDEFEVWSDPSEPAVPHLIHAECGEAVCLIEDSDSMAVLVTTVLAHEC